MPGIPREIYKWLQSLEISHTIKDPKFDLANGYLFAQMLQRYHPHEIKLWSYENGQSLECRTNNWETLFRAFKKMKFHVQREEFDEVMHRVDDRAVFFLCRVYEFCTGKKAALFHSPEKPPKPSFARETASWKLKDSELERVEDTIHRTIKRIRVLELHNDELARERLGDGTGLQRFIGKAQRNEDAQLSMQSKLSRQKTGSADSHGQIRDVTVNALSTVNRDKADDGTSTNKAPNPSAPDTLKAISVVGDLTKAVGAVKAVGDILKPLILAHLDKETINAGCASGNAGADLLAEAPHIVTGFVDCCVRETIPEDKCVKVMHELVTRSKLFCDSLQKSSTEMWKTWRTFFPLLDVLEVHTPLYNLGIQLWKQIGVIFKKADPSIAHRYMVDICLPNLIGILAREPLKRESLIDFIYFYIYGGGGSNDPKSGNVVARLQCLKSVKDGFSRSMSNNQFTQVYLPCLSYFCEIDCLAQPGQAEDTSSSPTSRRHHETNNIMLNEHLLDLYLYYALFGLQQPQPHLRVAGLSILSTIACSGSAEAVFEVLSSVRNLVHDRWWEVHAQLLILCSNLLSKFCKNSSNIQPRYHAGLADIFTIIKTSFDCEKISKNACQVGLSHLARNLREIPELCNIYMNVLLHQSTDMRKRLLTKKGEGDTGAEGTADSSLSSDPKIAYVNGTSARLYPECDITQYWNPTGLGVSLAALVSGTGDAFQPDDTQKDEGVTKEWIAQTCFVSTLQAERFESEHLEVIYRIGMDARQSGDMAKYAAQWHHIYDDLKKYIFLSLIDAVQHAEAGRILLDCFWKELAGLEGDEGGKWNLANVLDVSKESFCSMWGLVLNNKTPELVDEGTLCNWLEAAMQVNPQLKSGLRNIIFSHYQETNPTEFGQTRLRNYM